MNPSNFPKAVLLATATIDPRGMPKTARANPTVRMNDYRWALGRWLKACDLPIVFCENSDADISPLQDVAEAHPGRVEFLSFQAESFPLHKGKGYGEVLILAHALSHSRLIHPDTRVVKITGRQAIGNFGRIWRGIEFKRFDVCCSWFDENLTFADTRFFAATPAFIRQAFIDRIEELDEREESKNYTEHLMARGVLREVLGGGRYEAMPERPRVLGFSATGNARVDPWCNTLPFRGVRRLRKILLGERR